MWPLIGNISSLIGIVSISSFFDDPWKSHIIIGGLFAIMIATAAFTMWRVWKWQTKIYPLGFIPIGIFIRFSTNDGKNYTHETYRQIQIKRAFLGQIIHKFFWTGSKEPNVESSLQEIGNLRIDPATGMRQRSLKFKNIRNYNDIETIHIRMTADDSDGKADSFLSTLIRDPVRVIQMRVELHHCHKASCAAMTAQVERRKLADGNQIFEPIKLVEYDLPSRSFEHVFLNPDAGYEYRLKWDKSLTGPKPVRATRKKGQQAPDAAKPTSPTTTPQSVTP